MVRSFSLLIVSLFFLSLSAQVEWSIGFGANYRMTDQTVFSGMDGKLYDQAFFSKSAALKFPVKLNGNDQWKVGVIWMQRGVQSTHILYPGINGPGSAGSHLPPRTNWSILKWESIGFPVSFQRGMDKFGFELTLIPFFTYREARWEYNRQDRTPKTTTVLKYTEPYGTDHCFQRFVNASLEAGIYQQLSSYKIGLNGFLQPILNCRGLFIYGAELQLAHIIKSPKLYN